MRILHLLASPYWSGPMENVALLAQAQRALGHQVTVAIDRKRRVAPSEELAAPRLEALGLLDGAGLELSVKSSPLAWMRDGARLRAVDAHVIHAHFSHDHLLARWTGRTGTPLVRSLHAERSLRASLPRADGFTVPARGWVARLQRSPAIVLPALVAKEFRPPEDRALLRGRLGLGGTPLVGMVSTFQASRRHALALQAFARLRTRVPDARLVLVGDGALLPAIRDQAATLGLGEAVTFAGYRSGAEFVAHLQALDELWVLGLGNDYSARAAAQARACGVRVVAVDEGALADHADVVIPVDPEALAAQAGASTRRAVVQPGAEEIAASVLALYRAAGARG